MEKKIILEAIKLLHKQGVPKYKIVQIVSNNTSEPESEVRQLVNEVFPPGKGFTMRGGSISSVPIEPIEETHPKPQE